jgi:3-(3-hydroxy-phenyl)propionate hydroxylase
VVDASGGRSAIRAATGLQMEGASYEGFFVIADIRIELPLPTERLAFFDPEWNPGNTILMHREPHGIWRVDYQLPEGETPEEALRPESLKARIDAQLAMIGHAGTPWEMDWSSVYSARTLTLADFVHGNLIFTGDAAHLLPIFGCAGPTPHSRTRSRWAGTWPMWSRAWLVRACWPTTAPSGWGRRARSSPRPARACVS